MSHSKKDLADRIAAALVLDEGVLAVLLIGSVARGIDSEDSDIDLAVFTQSIPRNSITTEVVEGTRVGIERFCTQGFPVAPSTPLLHLQELRDVGRFVTSKVLYSRWERLPEVRQAWLDALLHPDEAAELFGLAAAYLNLGRIRACPSVPDRLWMIQGAASALATLALSICQVRFQKPKWVVRDLKSEKQAELLKGIRRFYFGRKVDSAFAQEVLGATKKELLAGLGLVGLPPLTIVENMYDKYPYVYRTFQDALSLERDGDFEGCVYTSMYSLRLLNALLQDQSALPRTLAAAEVAQWRHRAVASVCPHIGLSLEALEISIQNLNECGQRLQKLYRQQYLEAENLEVVRERWGVPTDR
jgi:hypothetical protein